MALVSFWSNLFKAFAHKDKCHLPVDKHGVGVCVCGRRGDDADVKVKTGRARAAFLQLKNIWASSNLTIDIKIKIFSHTVKTVLLYGA